MDSCQKTTQLPQLYGALVLIFPADTPTKDILDVLQEQPKCIKYPDCMEITYREVDPFHSWNIDDLLTQLFSLCDLDLITHITHKFHGRVFLDISFHHYETYPSLVFEGKNMAIIHSLQADIGIDPY